jgi:hypothetical protein
MIKTVFKMSVKSTLAIDIYEAKIKILPSTLNSIKSEYSFIIKP